jgi:outer membrane protein OmpA-like peptidoglycan-associated protein
MRHLSAFALLLGLAACAGQPHDPPLAAGQPFPVYFSPWSVALDSPALDVVQVAATRAAQLPGATVLVAGYADPEGSRTANDLLSRTRAQVVADQLIADGVGAGRISVVGHGERAFTQSSLESRRAEITIDGK